MDQSGIIDRINHSSWADFSLESVEIDFNDVILHITDTESTKKLSLFCKGYIGFSRFGHWDEFMIDSLKISDGGEATKKSLAIVVENYGDSPLPGGGFRSVDSNWKELQIKFIDNSFFTVVFFTIAAEEA